MELSREDWDSTYESGFEYGNVPDHIVDKLISYLPETEDREVLDLGSGTGRLARTLSEHGFSVVGLDFSSEAIEKARDCTEDLKVQYEVADLESDFSALVEPAPLITCRYVYAFLQNREQFLQQVKGLLKPGGAFVLVNPLKSAVPEYKKYIALETEQIAEEVSIYFDIVEYFVTDGKGEYFVCR